MPIAADSSNSSTVSRSLIINSASPCSGTLARMVDIPISIGIITFIPLVIANGDIPVGLRAVVL